MNSSDQTFAFRATADMDARQNERTALQLLLAQRRLYNRAKLWAYLRYVGLAAIGIAAPITAFVAPHLSVAMGALAGGWIFIARFIFHRIEQHYAGRGATVQENFDHRVFGMPDPPPRVPSVSAEDVSRLTGKNEKFERAVSRQKLRGWYYFEPSLDAFASVAIAQRANAIYSENLLLANARTWLALTVAWTVAVFVLGWRLDLSVERFMLGVFLPLLPALLDVYEQWNVTRKASQERRALADSVEDALRAGAVTSAELVAWQTTLYQLRKEAPQVPSLVYWLLRDRNERAMKAGADAMADLARRTR